MRLARRLRRGGNDKDHHLLLVFLVGDPGRQQRACITLIQLHTTDGNVIEGEDGEKEERTEERRVSGAWEYNIS